MAIIFDLSISISISYVNNNYNKKLMPFWYLQERLYRWSHNDDVIVVVALLANYFAITGIQLQLQLLSDN